MNDSEMLSPGRREARARMMRRRRVTVIAGLVVLAVLLTVGIAWGIAANRSVQPAPTARLTEAPQPNPEPSPSPPPQPTFDVASPDSITVVVNKQRPMNPIDWEPSDLVVPEGIANNWGDFLRAPAASALQQLYAAAAEAGYPFIITSGYRDYARQAALFEGYVESDGVEIAETYSARPGHSEHQTGLVVDLTDGGECTLEECFGETGTGLWLRDNAWRFGFILRYEQGEQSVVGYSYEPWHFRYVGIDVSTAMHEQGVPNLEDFLGLPAAPDYR